MTAAKTYDNPVEELAALLAFLNTKTAAEKREILKVTEGAKVAVKYYTNDSRYGGTHGNEDQAPPAANVGGSAGGHGQRVHRDPARTDSPARPDADEERRAPRR